MAKTISITLVSPSGAHVTYTEDVSSLFDALDKAASIEQTMLHKGYHAMPKGYSGGYPGGEKREFKVSLSPDGQRICVVAPYSKTVNYGDWLYLLDGAMFHSSKEGAKNKPLTDAKYHYSFPLDKALAVVNAVKAWEHKQVGAKIEDGIAQIANGQQVKQLVNGTQFNVDTDYEALSTWATKELGFTPDDTDYAYAYATQMYTILPTKEHLMNKYKAYKAKLESAKARKAQA